MPDQRSPGPSAWAADTPLGAGHLSPTHTPPRPGDQPGGGPGKPGPERAPLGGEFTHNAGRSALSRKSGTPSRWMSWNVAF